jgi:hypothetical protein
LSEEACEDLIARWEILSGEAPRGKVAPTPTPAPARSDPAEAGAEAERFAILWALHRGFRDAHRESYGTDFTAWERPLPQLAWAHQPVAKVKAWIEAGGFPWEVEAALKRGRKTEEEAGAA